MSEHNTPHATPTVGPHGTDRVVVRSARVGVGSARADRVVSWIGWHLVELTGVGVPAVLAVTTHPVWAVPAGLVAAGWVVHEVRRTRRGPRTVSAPSAVQRRGEPGTGPGAADSADKERQDVAPRDVAAGNEGWTA